MNSFVHRDERRLEISAASTLIVQEQERKDAQIELLSELSLLLADSWLVSDRTFELVTIDWLRGFATGLDLLAAVGADPYLVAINRQPWITQQQADDTVALTALWPPDDQYLDMVRATVGDLSVMEQYFQAAHYRWLMTDPHGNYPYRDIVTLLPVRLETLFDPPVDGEFTWTLRLRVVPDEVSVVQSSRYLTPAERVWLAEFWSGIRQPGDVDPTWLDTPEAGVAWRLLAERVTAKRAAWLVSAIPLDLGGPVIGFSLPADFPEEPEDRNIAGLPDRLTVLADVIQADGSVAEVEIGQLPEDPNSSIAHGQLKLQLPRHLDEELKRWWSNWDEACKIGVGGNFPLDLGVDPTTIKTLYLIGTGEAETAEHFTTLIESGDLQLIRPGTTTNVVKDSDPELSPPVDWLQVARDRLTTRIDPNQPALLNGAATLSAVLAGSSDALPAFPGAHFVDDCQRSHELAIALWPALFGHWFRDYWEAGDHAYLLGYWGQLNFHPSGPLMPIRVGDQPYGMLPVTSLDWWEPDDTNNSEMLELQGGLKRLAEILNFVRAELSATAENPTQKGTVVDSDYDNLIRLLGRPGLSGQFAYRAFAPLPVWLGAYPSWSGDLAAAEAIAESTYQFIFDYFGGDPLHRPYISNGYWQPNHLPLVKPNKLMHRRFGEGREERDWGPHVPLSEFLTIVKGSGLVALDDIFEQWWGDPDSFRFSTLPDSLLYRLLVYSFQLMEAWSQSPPIFSLGQEMASRWWDTILEIADSLDKKAQEEENAVTGHKFYSSLLNASQQRELEESLRATLDATSHRVDPWITGFAWDRLVATTASERKRQRLGVYGWVDGPFRGDPGPTVAGLLHTPSQVQTTAAVIMRDAWLSHDDPSLIADSKGNPWQMDITSAKARLAIEIADEVRLGFHIYEVIGRMVEEIVGDHTTIRTLRQTEEYAMRKERKDPNEVCNGMAALPVLAKNKDAQFPMSDNQQKALLEILGALDTYGDSLVADGIMHLVDRQIDRASESMDAAAGLTRPPVFQFLQTPPSGYQLDTSVVSVLPYLALDPNENHPVKIVDPSVAEWVENRLDIPWTWIARSDENDPAPLAVTSSELGFSLADLLVLSPGFLEDLVRDRTGKPEIVAPVEHRQTLHLVDVLASQPARAEDLISRHDPPTRTQRQAEIDNAIRAELAQRFTRIVDARQKLQDDLESPASDSARVLMLRRALAWGAVPAAQPSDSTALYAALNGRAIPEGSTSLELLCQHSAEILKARVPEGSLDGIPALSRAILAIANPTARLPVTGAWDRAKLLFETDLKTAAPDDKLEDQWLTIIAAPRAPLARLEAVQLEIEDPLEVWSNSPGDPWRTGADKSIAKNLQNREEWSVANMDTTRFVAAFGDAAAWTGGKVAVGLIDSFGEAIPMPQRITSAAFGFNAPSSRPPQTILLAVPPVPGSEIDDATAAKIVRETRLTALARSLRTEETGKYQAVAPTGWLQASGPTRFRREPWPLTTAELGS